MEKFHCKQLKQQQTQLQTEYRIVQTLELNPRADLNIVGSSAALLHMMP